MHLLQLGKMSIKTHLVIDFLLQALVELLVALVLRFLLEFFQLFQTLLPFRFCRFD